MWLAIIIALVVAAVAVVQLRFIPPPMARTLIRVRGGSLQIRGERLRPHAREQVEDLLREGGVVAGFIAITRANRVVFSRSIPPTLQQRLRNVILNQWA